MAEFTVNPKRLILTRILKFRVKWDGKYVAGISKVSGLQRTTEVNIIAKAAIPDTSRKSPGLTDRAITLSVVLLTTPNSRNGPIRCGSSAPALVRKFR